MWHPEEIMRSKYLWEDGVGSGFQDLFSQFLDDSGRKWLF
jgi:hypothetical protein